MAAQLTGEIFSALTEQTTVVTGTQAAEHITGHLAAQLQQLTQQRTDIEAEILLVVDAHPLTQVLTSMPGVGVRTAARILTEVVGKDFKSAARLASYAGIAPVTSRSGTSIRGESPSRRGNKALKRVLFLSAFASIKGDPAPVPITTRNEPKENATTKPSSRWPDAAQTFSLPCSETAPFTNPAPHNLLQQLDGNYRSTPQNSRYKSPDFEKSCNSAPELPCTGATQLLP